MRTFQAILLVGTLASCQAHFISVTPDEYEARMKEPNARLIDVRTPKEYAEGHIPGAINIDVSQKGFRREVARQVDRKSETVMVNCKGGVRSKKAAAILSRHRYKVVDLDKGYTQWTNEKKPTTTR